LSSLPENIWEAKEIMNNCLNISEKMAKKALIKRAMFGGISVTNAGPVFLVRQYALRT